MPLQQTNSITHVAYLDTVLHTGTVRYNGLQIFRYTCITLKAILKKMNTFFSCLVYVRFHCLSMSSSVTIHETTQSKCSI